MDYRGASPKYAAAFWDNGFDFDTLSTDELVRLLNASPVRPYLLAALDDWAFTGSADVKQLAAVTTEATGQRWRTRLPEVWNDGARLAKVYDAIPKGERSPGLIAGVGERLERLHQDGVRQVEDGLRQYPGDFWLHVLMGNLGDRSHAERKIGAYRAALALRPGAAAVHFSLGRAMHGRRDLDGAIAYYKEAIRLDPKYAHAHAILGNALGAKGDLDGAIACCREAIRLDPKFSFAHYNLGLALVQKKDLDGAIAAYRVAIGLDPKYVEAHYSLGNASRAKGDLESAIASYREAIRLDPEDGLAYGGLGSTAMHLGRMRDAVDALDKAHSLLPDNKAIHANRTKARRLLVLDQRLSAIKQGTDKPKSASEAVAVAELAGQPRQKEYARSYRLFLFAFADDAKLEAENRYNAACAAVLFAAGEDPKEKPPGKHRTSLLKQAGEWLAADLSPLRELAASEKAADRQRAATTLGHWLWDADLSSVRDPKRLEALPPEERERWEAFWADVRATLAKAAAGVRKR